MRIYFSILILLSFFSCYAQTDSTHNSVADTIPWVGIVDKDVSFKGPGTVAEYINNNLSHTFKRYITDNNIKGKVFIKLLINKNGKVISTNVIRGINNRKVENYFMEVMKKIEWVPAYCNGNPVNRIVILPILL